MEKYHSLNIFNFGLFLFNHFSCNGSRVINKKRFCKAVQQTIDMLDKHDCLDANCFDWYFRNNSSKIDNLELLFETFTSFNILKLSAKGNYIYDNTYFTNKPIVLEPSVSEYCHGAFKIIYNNYRIEKIKEVVSKYKFPKILKPEQRVTLNKISDRAQTRITANEKLIDNLEDIYNNNVHYIEL